jgi:hypothetical protein
VRAYAQRWTDAGDAALFQPLTAMAEQVVLFEFGKPVEVSYSDGSQYVSSCHEIIGAATRSEPHRAIAHQLKVHGGTESFAIFFQPAGFSQLFAVPMYELTNRAYDATLVAGYGIRALWNKLGENPAFEHRVRIVEQFLLQRASRAPAYEKIGSVANYILRQRGAIRMTHLASRSALGLRQLERSIGLPGGLGKPRHVCLGRQLSESEREYVVRASSTTPFWWGATISTGQANYDANQTYAGGPKGEYRKGTVSVDTFVANPWGLYNVHGNVWEWTEDCWNEKNAGNPGNGSARTSSDCGSRVLRGGAWHNGPQIVRSAFRDRNPPDNRNYAFGFRVARTLD